MKIVCAEAAVRRLARARTVGFFMANIENQKQLIETIWIWKKRRTGNGVKIKYMLNHII